MSFKQTHEMEATPEECLRELTEAFNHLDYEVNGNQIIVQDDGRKLIIDLVYEEDRHLGSLVLPMTQIDYEFINYTKQEMDGFMVHLRHHIFRMGG